MEEALQPLDEADQPIRLNKHLVVGIAASVILHLGCTLLLLGLPGGGAPARQSITYVDLGQAPAHPPTTPPAAQPIQQKELLPPETPPVPDTPLKAQQTEAEQPKGAPEQPAARESVTEEKSHTTLGLGLTKGYFRSLGDGETLRQDVKGYYLEMLQGINEKWWLDQQFDQQRINPIVINITVARNGDIVGSAVMISSGNPRYDRAVQRSLAEAGPLPPLPAEYEGDFFQAPIRLVPPLNLMAW